MLHWLVGFAPSVGKKIVGKDVLERFTAGIPAELMETVLPFLDHPRISPDDLLGRLDEYTLRIDAEARHREDLDVNLAEEILRVYCRLLQQEWSALDDDERRLVTVGCSYYLDRGDQEGDLDSVFGFDDDARILNLVVEAIGRSNLRVAI